MYVRVIQFVIGAGTLQEVVDRIQGDLLPIYRESQGFLAYYVAAAADDTLVTIRVFDDKESLEDANAAASDESEQIRKDFSLTFSENGEGDVLLFAQPSE